MRKSILMLVALALLAVAVVHSGQRVGLVANDATVRWSHRVSTGSVLYYNYDDSVQITGASDSLYSVVYPSLGGDMSLQVRFYGGTTKSFYVLIQAANPGDRVVSTLADSDFVTLYSVAYTGAYATGAVVATTLTALTTAGAVTTPPIIVPPLGAGYFRFFVYSSGSQSGNTVVKLWLRNNSPFEMR